MKEHVQNYEIWTAAKCRSMMLVSRML